MNEGRRRRGLEARVQEMFVAFPCVGIPPSAGRHVTKLKISQQRWGLSLEDNDLWIAATAMAIGVTPVSHDRDFGRLDHLSVLSPRVERGGVNSFV